MCTYSDLTKTRRQEQKLSITTEHTFLCKWWESSNISEEEKYLQQNVEKDFTLNLLFPVYINSSQEN